MLSPKIREDFHKAISNSIKLAKTSENLFLVGVLKGSDLSDGYKVLSNTLDWWTSSSLSYTSQSPKLVTLYAINEYHSCYLWGEENINADPNINFAERFLKLYNMMSFHKGIHFGYAPSNKRFLIGEKVIQKYSQVLHCVNLQNSFEWFGNSKELYSKLLATNGELNDTSPKMKKKQEFEIEKAPLKGYAEEGQTKNIKFSFFTGTEYKAKELFSPVICRDFLSDVIWANNYKKSSIIYGFEFDGATKSLDKNFTKLLVYFDNDNSKENFIKNKDVFQHLIDKNKFNINECYYFPENYSNLAIGYLNPIWQSSAVLISTITFIIRALCYKYDNPINWKEELMNNGSKDATYMKKIYKKFSNFEDKLKLFRGSEDNVTGWEKEDKEIISKLHNFSGIVSVFSDPTNPAVKKNTFAKLVNKGF